MSAYSKDYKINDADVNMYRCLSTSSLFRLMETISVEHSEALGVGRKKTLDKNIAWVVALQNVKILSMPKYEDIIHIETWAGSTSHTLFPRYYKISSCSGELLVSACALWTLIDLDTRRIVSPNNAGIFVAGEKAGLQTDYPPLPPKNILTTNSNRFTVPYSYIDMYGHMNNTKYFDVAEDFIKKSNVNLCEITAQYINECKLGENIEIKMGQEEEEYFYITGDSDKKLFRIGMQYR